MKTIFDHIELVKGKPHHIRKQVAFASATVGAAFIALVWLAGSLSTGVFSIQESSFAGATGQEPSAVAGEPGNQNLAGVGAASALPESVNTPAHIEIIDAASPSVKKQAEQTTIPF